MIRVDIDEVTSREVCQISIYLQYFYPFVPGGTIWPFDPQRDFVTSKEEGLMLAIT